MTQLALDTRSLEPVKARDLMEEAIEWIAANRAGWAYIVAHTRADVLLGRRVAIKRYLEELRDDPTIAPGRDGETVKLKNALSAPFGRILAAWYPEMKPLVPLHQSKCDGCIVPPRPHWCDGL